MKFSKNAVVLYCFCAALAIILVYAGIRHFFFDTQLALTGVVIENHEDARPHHAGLDKALLVEEWLVEGFISRLVAVFDANSLPWKAGPIRSLRPYFLEALFPWHVPIFHAGGSPQALEIIGSTYTLTSINGIGSYNDKFQRDADLSPPHDLFIHKREMSTILKEDGLLKKTSWPPYKVGPAPQSAPASQVNLNFFSPLHNVQYIYEYSGERYTRKSGEEKSAAQPKNVLILEMPIQNIGEQGRLEIAVQGKGRVLLFRSGKVYEGHWEKKGRSTVFSFTDKEGNPLVFAHGQTWMTVLPTLDRVSFSFP